MMPKEEQKQESKDQKSEDKRKITQTKALKGKNWYHIVAPEFFGSKPLGETLAVDQDQLKGRVVSASLMELTEDPSRYYMTMHFKITGFEGQTARTVFHGHEVTRDFTARIVQLRTQRLDTNDVLQLKDGKLRVKTVCISNRRLTESTAKAVRAELKNLIAESAKGKTIEQFVDGFVTGTLQANIRQTLNKIYPIRHFEFRKTEVL